MSLDTDSIHAAVSVFGAKAPKFIALTLADAQRYMQELQAALEDKNAQEAGLAGHALKSIFKQVGATEIASLAEEVQHKGAAGDLAGCESLYAQMQPVYAQLETYLKTL